MKMREIINIVETSGGASRTPAFKQWFGNSKVVDKNGDPLVVYHGTGDVFDVFNTNGGTGKTNGTGGFFSSSPDTASTYSVGHSGNVMPVFLSLQNPAVIDGGGVNWDRLGKKTRAALPSVEVSDQEDEELLAALQDRKSKKGTTKKLKARNTTLGRIFPDEFRDSDDCFSTDDLARWARKQGYDGIIIKNVKDHGPSGAHSSDSARSPNDLYVVFKPTQIKSAIGNNGNFNPEREPISEAFDAPYPFEAVKLTDQREIWKFRTTKGEYYYVTLRTKIVLSKILTWLSFENSDYETTVTGTGDAFRVFATVIAILKDFVRRSHPDKLSFAGKGESRQKLYDVFAQRLSSVLPDYSFDIATDDDNGEHRDYIFSKVKTSAAL